MAIPSYPGDIQPGPALRADVNGRFSTLFDYLPTIQLPSGGTLPSSPSQGQIYLDTSDGYVYVYTGTAWRKLSAIDLANTFTEAQTFGAGLVIPSGQTISGPGGISITGNIAAVQGTFSGLFTPSGGIADIPLANTTDLNTVVLSGFYLLGTGNPNAPTGVDGGQLIVARGGTTVLQIASASGNEQHFYMRQGSGIGGTATWQAWNQIAVAGVGTIPGLSAAQWNGLSSLNYQSYATAGSFNFTVPDNVYWVYAWIWGSGAGGGGGGSSDSTTGGSGGAGGGAGGFTQGWLPVTPGQVISGSVGLPGSGGSGGAYPGANTGFSGANGSASTFGSFSANGGTAGTGGNPNNGAPGTGGSGGGSSGPQGSTSLTGGAGQNGGGAGTQGLAGPGGAGGVAPASSSNYGNGGQGGDGGIAQNSSGIAGANGQVGAVYIFW